ncbi:hypothetical protein MKW98_017488 [Papaver atlanticum]|uniref:J domain-containing protein n=1 Tax=Papaver atlanticum TaxID=357466 RepID=A0AAD4XVE8_9MAGN|nr:hypothetical protein MKW98_017488 [Papaver atlanticum]
MSGGQSQPRTQLGRIPCKYKGKVKIENVVIIDLETDEVHTATVGGKIQRRSVISIDDDDDDGDDGYFNPRNNNKAGAGSSGNDDCNEKKTNWNEAYYRKKNLSRNHSTSYPIFESDSSSESDSSECEVMEGSIGKIREQWEKAAFTKNMYGDIRRGQTGLEDRASTTDSSSDTEIYCKGKAAAARHRELPTCSSSSSSPIGDDIHIDPFCDLDENHSTDDSAQNADLPWWRKIRSMNKVTPGRDCFQVKEEKIPAESCDIQAQPRKKTCFNYRDARFPSKEHTSHNGPQLNKTELSQDSVYIWDEDEGIFREPSKRRTERSSDEVVVNNGATCSERKDKLSSDKAVVNNGATCSERKDKPIPYGREKYKETDEHKRATAEEWASRKEQLQIQSQEAKQLRKRRRAEKLRLLDVERRQKKRVEELREIMTKAEESIDLKERIRVEVRNKLDKLEMQCTDMATLLRRLDIHVEGGPNPLPREVHAAYRKALLRFHPDRASRTDIRQQVEAEEKFKLISKSKEKLLQTS